MQITWSWQQRYLNEVLTRYNSTKIDNGKLIDPRYKAQNAVYRLV